MEVPMVDEAHDAANEQEDRRELVQVFDTREESEAMVVRGLLESAGIEAVTASLEAPQDVLPGVGGITVRVRAADAEEARRLIEEYRSADESVELDDGSGDGDEVSDETPGKAN
jgi:hypothetical protein